ncbi:methyltransferase domain-containing protein [Streptomyces sp. NPDC052020]|uniref:methyltransferase domain-containing protein n=1 Tax=Streptomyces sp. NPDC052020 TaxID=3155677 RepID=UPI003423AE9F
MEDSMVHSFSGQVGDFYDRSTDLLCSNYDQNLHYGYWSDPADGSLADATERMTDQLIARLDARPGHRVLDVGCGVGRPALRVARETGADVTGISISRHQIDLANAGARAEGLQDRVRFHHADAMDLAYDTASFDRVWALESMLHMPDRARVVQEMARVLRPGGRLVIADAVVREEPADEASRIAVDRFCAAIHAASLERLDAYPALVTQAGLRLTDITDVSVRARPTITKILEELRRTPAETVAQLGESAFTAYVRAFEGIAALPHVGYILLIADKP